MFPFSKFVFDQKKLFKSIVQEVLLDNTYNKKSKDYKNLLFV